MSVSEYYTLTNMAEEDLIEIIRFSEAEFGKQQTLKHLQAIHEVSEYVGKNHKILRSRSEFAADCAILIYPVEKYYMLCHAISEEHILILGYLAKERDIPNIIKRNSHAINQEISKFVGVR